MSSASVHKSRRFSLGGAAAILIGALNVVIIIYFTAASSGSRTGQVNFFESFSGNALMMSIPWIVFTISAVLSYAALPAVWDLVRGNHPEWERFATLFGIIGYTVQGVWAITLTRSAPYLSHTYLSGNEVTRTALLAYGLPQIDPDGWFSFGGPGTWLIIINILAILGGKLPKWHAALGILAGVCAWATVFASLLAYDPLNLFASAGGAIVFPAWFILTGVRLLRGKAGDAEGKSA
jgi:hypothetical protein